MTKKEVVKKESATAFLKRVTGLEDGAEAQQVVEKALQMGQNQQVALQNMGTITIIVVPGGAFGWHLSDNLNNRVALDSVDKALNDVQEEVIDMRRQLTEEELRATAEKIVKQQEESDGSNSIDGPGHSENGS